MPDRLHALNVTCPASTPATAPVEVVFSAVAPGIPRRFTIVIPDGHAGLTGIALAFGHQPVIPNDTGTFLSGNDETFSMELSGYPPGPTWSAFVCNADLQPHSWQVRFELDELRTGQPVTPTTELAVQDIIKAGEDLALRTQQSETPDLTTSLPSPIDETGSAEDVTADSGP